MRQQPCQLGRREIGIDDETRGFGHVRAPALALERGAERRRTPVLPYDGIGEGLPRRAIPDDRGLALIGDANGGNGLRAGLVQHRAADLEHGAPDFLRIVLHLPRRREDLSERHARRGVRTARVVE